MLKVLLFLLFLRLSFGYQVDSTLELKEILELGNELFIELDPLYDYEGVNETLNLPSNVLIDGHGATVVLGDFSFSCVGNGNITIRDLVIVKKGSGGNGFLIQNCPGVDFDMVTVSGRFNTGILIINSDVRMKDSSLFGMVAVSPDDGAAILTTGVYTLFMKRVLVTDCTSNDRGVVRLRDIGNVVIRNCTFRNNTALKGGAIANTFTDRIFSSLEIEGCTFEQNTALAVGGAINLATTMNSFISDSLFIDNCAQVGAHININSAESQTANILMSITDNRFIGGCVEAIAVDDTFIPAPIGQVNIERNEFIKISIFLESSKFGHDGVIMLKDNIYNGASAYEGTNSTSIILNPFFERVVCNTTLELRGACYFCDGFEDCISCLYPSVGLECTDFCQCDNGYCDQSGTECVGCLGNFVGPSCDDDKCGEYLTGELCDIELCHPDICKGDCDYDKCLCDRKFEGQNCDVCISNWTGTDCDGCVENKAGMNCDIPCNCAHGICNQGVHGDGGCLSCHTLYSGSDCSCYNCGNGNCFNSRCVCKSGFQGEFCQDIICLDSQTCSIQCNGTCNNINSNNQTIEIVDEIIDGSLNLSNGKVTLSNNINITNNFNSHNSEISFKSDIIITSQCVNLSNTKLVLDYSEYVQDSTREHVLLRSNASCSSFNNLQLQVNNLDECTVSKLVETEGQISVLFEATCKEFPYSLLITIIVVIVVSVLLVLIVLFVQPVRNLIFPHRERVKKEKGAQKYGTVVTKLNVLNQEIDSVNKQYISTKNNFDENLME